MAIVQISKSKNEAQLFKLKLTDMLILGDRSGWVEIMDYIYTEMPFLMTQVRPRSNEIQSSLIGQLGYNSWKAFIEEEIEWSNDKWREWRKAYKRVQDHPYLRELQLSRNAINEAYKILKNDFPKDKKAWEIYRLNKKEHQSHSLKHVIHTMKSEYALISQQLSNVEKERDNYCEQLSHEQRNNQELLVQLTKLKFEETTNNERTIAENIELQKKIKKLNFIIQEMDIKMSEQKLEVEECDVIICEQEREKKYMFFIALLIIALVMLVNIYTG